MHLSGLLLTERLDARVGYVEASAGTFQTDSILLRAHEVKTIGEQARDIPVADECDVCVVGGSCTGVFAAVTAARLGAKVCLIERHGFFGGMATAAMVSIWHSLHDVTFERKIIGGLTVETIERLAKRNAVEIFDGNVSRHCVLNTEELKIELDELIGEHGIRPFLHAWFAEPILADGQLAAVVIEDKSGRRAIRARYFIDATGDGDLLARMGLPFTLRDDLQPPTTCVVLRGMKDIAARHPEFTIRTILEEAELPEHVKHGFVWTAAVPGAADDTLLAGTRMNGTDCSEADQLTQAEIEGRRQARAMADVLRRYSQEGACPITALPAGIGIRETRHAQGLHTLTEEEVLYGVRFPDAIANGSYRVDVHHSDKPGLTFRYLDGREVYCVPGREAQVGRWREETDEYPTFYQIPYRSLVPQGSRNVLATGRLVDSDRGAYGAVRVMVNTNQTGEAAGAAAWLALRGGRGVAEVDTDRLRETLRAQGAIII